MTPRTMPLQLKSRTFGNLWVGRYFTEHVRRYIETNYGNSTLYKGGLNIYTTLNVDLQKAANEAVRSGIIAHDRRRGYKGPLHNLTTPVEITAFTNQIEKDIGKAGLKKGSTYYGVIDATPLVTGNGSYTVLVGSKTGVISAKDMKWARLYNPENTPNGAKKVKLDKIFKAGSIIEVEVKKIHEGDQGRVELRLTQEPQAQAALLAMDSRSGNIVAMVGGYDFSKSEYNRAVQAKRQPG